TVTLMTFLNLPASASQAVVGAIIGIGMGAGTINLRGLEKVVLCWVGTPVGAALLALILYPVLGKLFGLIRVNIFVRGYILKAGLIAAGCYGAYALGANNVANTTGVYAQTGIITTFQAVLLGGLSIVIGVLTYSKRVMMTVGKKLVKLDPFSSFITVLAHAIIIHIFAKIGVPVSGSQAIIGAVLGVGLLKGVQTIQVKVLLGIIFGWIGTPLIAGVISFGLLRVFG
ncbi:MAG: anion permease, partial [Spirochaetales bacterium]|nr:anion permease [Spirochaetales bacterium]